MRVIKSNLVIFDLDGVITDTANIHFKAWSSILNSKLKNLNLKRKFIDSDYYLYIDGKARNDAIRFFFKKIKYELKKKDIEQISKSKNILFKKLIKKKKLVKFNDSVKLLKQIKNSGIKIGLASSSKNAKFIVNKLKIKSFFNHICDGNIIEKKKLNSKPSPDIFLLCSKKLKEKEFTVIEDSVSGIKAAKRAKAQNIIAVNRKNNYKLLKKAGASIIVNKLDNLYFEK